MIKKHLSVWKLSNMYLDDSFSKDDITMEIENISSKMITNAHLLMFIGWTVHREFFFSFKYTN